MMQDASLKNHGSFSGAPCQWPKVIIYNNQIICHSYNIHIHYEKKPRPHFIFNW